MSQIKYTSAELPEPSGYTPKIAIPIQKVGVKNVTVPLKLLVYGSDEPITVVASVDMFTELPASKKGISMSPLIRSLAKHLKSAISLDYVRAVLEEQRKITEVGANSSYIKFRFKYPITKESPASTDDNGEPYRFPEYYDCEFEATLKGGEYRQYITSKVYYLSCCPCSLELAEHMEKVEGQKGVPHVQRASAKVTVEVPDDKFIYIEELVWRIEKAFNYTLPYPIIRRPDELELARRAYQNPMFVEDAARNVASALEDESRIDDYVIVVVSEESIHRHDAVAVVRKGVSGGLR